MTQPIPTDLQLPDLSDLPAEDRLRILTATVEVFVAHGYAETTVVHLQTQIDPAAFDALFENTEDCFLQTYNHLIAQATAIFATSIPAEAPWPDRLADALTTVFELIEANPTAARLVLLETQLATPDVLAAYMATINAIARFMREGRVLSELSPPPIVDTALPGGVAHVLGARLRDRPSEPIADLYPDLLRVLLLPYLGDTDTTAFLATRPTGAPHA